MRLRTTVAIGTSVGLLAAVLAGQAWVAVVIYVAYVAWMFVRPSTRGRIQ